MQACCRFDTKSGSAGGELHSGLLGIHWHILEYLAGILFQNILIYTIFETSNSPRSQLTLWNKEYFNINS